MPESLGVIGDNRSMAKTDSPSASGSAFYKAFRERLKGFRNELGWSQDKMAKALGLSKANYAKYEDRSKFPLHKLEQLASVTHTSIEYVVTGSRSKVKTPPLRVVGE